MLPVLDTSHPVSGHPDSNEVVLDYNNSSSEPLGFSVHVNTALSSPFCRFLFDGIHLNLLSNIGGLLKLMSDQHSKDQLSYYDNQTSDYEKRGMFHRGLSRAYERKARIIYKQLAAIGAKRVLEIGAGSGLMTYFLVNIFDGEYVALDLSAEMLKLAEERIRNEKVQYVVGDGTAPDFDEGYFDAVIGVDIIHHLESPITAFANWKKLVPGTSDVRSGNHCRSNLLLNPDIMHTWVAHTVPVDSMSELADICVGKRNSTGILIIFAR